MRRARDAPAPRTLATHDAEVVNVARELPAACRAAGSVARRAADGAWQLTPAPIPTAIPAAAGACAER